ncbi:hypothetical protein T11_16017, partial [Trichinella zimbabwensis]
LRVFVEVFLQKLIKCNSSVYYEDGRLYVALNCSHYNRIMIKRLRHYLDK